MPSKLDSYRLFTRLDLAPAFTLLGLQPAYFAMAQVGIHLALMQR